jgi:hypothetical protein
VTLQGQYFGAIFCDEADAEDKGQVLAAREGDEIAGVDIVDAGVGILAAEDVATSICNLLRRMLR